MQMLKFGRLVDFERLENVSVNRIAEELKERLRQQEAQNTNQLLKWDVSNYIRLFLPSVLPSLPFPSLHPVLLLTNPHRLTNSHLNYDVVYL